jgi:hypothetical protein
MIPTLSIARPAVSSSTYPIITIEGIVIEIS